MSSKGKKGGGFKKKGKGFKKESSSGGEKRPWQPLTILSNEEDGPANKKRALRRQRAVAKPYFEAVTASKVLWNELREKKCPEPRRAALVAELHGALLGKYKEVALKHDASRLVQAVIQYGNEEQRLQLFEEISGPACFMDICKSPYAHYCITKLIEHLRSKEMQKKLTKALQGHMLQLATHGVGARVVELALQELRPAQTAVLRLELYGKEFTLFADEVQAALKDYAQQQQEQADAAGAADSADAADGAESKGLEGGTQQLPPVTSRPTLKALLAVRSQRKEAIMTAMGTLVGKFFTKGLLPFQYAQELLCEYLEECEQTQFDELLSLVVENALVLLSTRAGTKTVCIVAARGGAKERRRLLKVLKGHTSALLTHRDAYLAVMVLCEVTDDTVAIQKSLLAELTVAPTAEEIAASKKYGANPFLDDDAAKAEDGQNNDKGGGDGDGDDDDDGMDDEEEDGDEDGPDRNGSDDNEEEEEEEEEEDDDDDEAHMPLLDVALDFSGSKLLLRLLAGVSDDRSESSGGGGGDSSGKYVDPEELKVLRLPCLASKKNPAVRREELAAFLQEPLLEIVASHAREMLLSRSGSAVVLETLRCFAMGSDDSGDQEDAPEVTRAVAAVVEAAPGVYDDAIAHRVLKNLLLAEAKAAAVQGARPVSLASMLVGKVGGATLGSWAANSNRGAFVVWALLQVPLAKSDAALMDGLAAKRAAIAANAKGTTQTKKTKDGKKFKAGTNGASLLLSELDEILPSSSKGKSAKTSDSSNKSKVKTAKKKSSAAAGKKK